ncbi:MAG: DUF1285 domain-containing protein, partial [Hyphomicrobiaceae bacterium]|nr:DUF1285 domain-containing protein [Hyphomicrobiaceae bacterium]
MQHEIHVEPSEQISGLELLLKKAGETTRAPVEFWNPPHCGDIGLAIRADGTWLYRGSPIHRLPLVKLFAGVLRRDADGRYYLVTPAEKVDVAVADAPFLAVEMEVSRTGDAAQLIFRTNLDDPVAAGPGNPLRFDVDGANGGLKPYILVRGRLEALVTRALTMDLVALAEPDAYGRLWI